MAVSLDYPKTQRAIVANDDLDYSVQDNVPVSPIRHDCIIIKTEYVGLNPVDTKMVGPFVGKGAIYGIDCAGTIVAMGASIAAAGRLKLGDRVAGGADGMEPLRPQSGAFAEYASVDGTMALKLPESMSFEVGASMPLRIATAAMALFHSLGLDPELLKHPAREGEGFDVLVYGGSTSTGTLAIQLLKICGLRVITTCSKNSEEMVRGYGADLCFDYNDPECGKNIRRETGNALEYALDCITEEGTMKICYEALGRCGGKYVGLEPYPEQTASTRRVVAPDWVLVTWMRGLPISWPEPYGTEKGKPECAEFGKIIMPYLHPLFESGQFKAHPIETQPNGFEGLLDGVAKVRKGQVKGKKLVYRTADRAPAVVAAAA